MPPLAKGLAPPPDAHFAQGDCETCGNLVFDVTGQRDGGDPDD